ncbi:hypothetical protein BWQ96_05964 [Gracilariopsis chorda]|uniref:Uncharacterized protein n=1 Tax=Gracilariopsis chorda TaxID=448386 RepID=A0A2V3IT20_9FLOR|nr:hypothetical protein BWQ96_05964 [Gracilariopsis chorda]|eukprot:PXF44260.1 hypothetical protein BWQ96_05964 [Gracilariopsis chorda]
MNICIRLLGFILSVPIVLALFTVSYKNEYWSLWGGERNASQAHPNFAKAAPVPEVHESSDLNLEHISDDVVWDAEVTQALAEGEEEQSKPRTEDMSNANS